MFGIRHSSWGFTKLVRAGTLRCPCGIRRWWEPRARCDSIFGISAFRLPVATDIDGLLVGLCTGCRSWVRVATAFITAIHLHRSRNLHAFEQHGKSEPRPAIWKRLLIFYQGWRYIWFGNGALVLVMSILRVTVIRLRETPKFLLSKGEDAKVIETFQYLATRYNRPMSLTLEKLEACGEIQSTYGGSKYGFKEFFAHLRGLYQTKLLGFSTAMIWLSWTLIGLAYVSLPQTRSAGHDYFETSLTYNGWRPFPNSTSACPDETLAALLCLLARVFGNSWRRNRRRFALLCLA